MTIECIYCGEKIVLNEDSEKTRALHKDPHQQMRMHIFRKHLKKLDHHLYNFSWIIDMLYFRSCDNAAEWRSHILASILALQEEQE